MSRSSDKWKKSEYSKVRREDLDKDLVDDRSGRQLSAISFEAEEGGRPCMKTPL